MELSEPPRSSKEVDFFVDEAPCETCGKRGLTQEAPAYRRGVFSAVCAHCGVRREFSFPPLTPHENAPLWHLGPADQASRLFGPDAFRNVADRELALAPPEPAELPTMAAWTQGRAHVGNARVALNELAKFRPDDAGLRDEIARAAELYAAYDQSKAVVAARPGAHPAPIGLDGRFVQHRAWFESGRVGDGQAVFRDEEWSRFSMATKLLNAALFEDSTFNDIDLSFGRFHEATFRRTRLLECKLTSTEFDHSVFERCDLTGSRLGLANLVDVVVVGGDWQRITGGRSTWRGRMLEVDLREASLQDSVLDDAIFEKCDLRGVDLSRKDPTFKSLGTARRTHFLECDLRGLHLEGLRLDGTIFERCRMHGLVGAPVLAGEVQIIDADLSLGGDGGPDAVGSARLAASWRQTGAT